MNKLTNIEKKVSEALLKTKTKDGKVFLWIRDHWWRLAKIEDIEKVKKNAK